MIQPHETLNQSATYKNKKPDVQPTHLHQFDSYKSFKPQRIDGKIRQNGRFNYNAGGKNTADADTANQLLSGKTI